jgi:hypothetical protein
MGRKADRPLLGSQTALADIPDAAALSQKGWWIGKAGSERARQRQNVIAGQGRQRHPGCRNVIDPDSFFDLRSRGRGVPHPHMKDFGFDGMIGFVRSRRGVAAKMACIAVNQRQPNLLVQLAAKRADGGFAVLDLSACLHEPLCSCLANEQQTARTIVDQRGCDPDRARGLVADAAMLAAVIYRSTSFLVGSTFGDRWRRTSYAVEVVSCCRSHGHQVRLHEPASRKLWGARSIP